MSEMIGLVMEDLQDRFDKALEALSRDLSKMRTGRANMTLLEGIRVSYYGSPTALNQLASVNIADPRLITVKPWEKNILTDIEKAIIAADIGITPSSDGEIIRLPIPPLTTERRKDLVKQVKNAGENAKITLRNVRRDCNETLKKSDDLPEDDMHRGLQKIQEQTDAFVTKVDTIVEEKQKEIMEV